jgi:hypothetical protein
LLGIRRIWTYLQQTISTTGSQSNIPIFIKYIIRFWYCIREEDHDVLENYAKATFVEHFRKCPEHLRHKTTLINPYLLK